jgi:hypothetical protein
VASIEDQDPHFSWASPPLLLHCTGNETPHSQKLLQSNHTGRYDRSLQRRSQSQLQYDRHLASLPTVPYQVWICGHWLFTCVMGAFVVESRFRDYLRSRLTCHSFGNEKKRFSRKMRRRRRILGSSTGPTTTSRLVRALKAVANNREQEIQYESEAVRGLVCSPGSCDAT